METIAELPSWSEYRKYREKEKSILGEGYKWFFKKYGDEDAERVTDATYRGHEMMEATGISLAPDDPHHDPDKMIIDVPDEESWRNLMELFRTSYFNMLADDGSAWVYFIGKGARFEDVKSGDYEADWLINTDKKDELHRPKDEYLGKRKFLNSLNPSQVSSRLRTIAQGIDNSRSPSVSLVVRDMYEVIKSIKG